MEKNTRIEKGIYRILIILIILLGVYIRIRAYLFERSLWADESSLALNVINTSIFSYFEPLSYSQFAPPFFMMLTNFNSKFLGCGEFALRLVPFLASILGVIVFYYFSKQFFSSKFSLLILNFLFAVNFNIIYYAQEFKPYSSDVLLFMVAVLVLSRVDLYELTKKQIVMLIAFGAFLVLSSLTVLFAIGGWGIYTLLNFKKSGYKKLIFFGSLSLILFSAYYFGFLLPSKSSMISDIGGFWNESFLTFNIIAILKIIKFNMIYYTQPNQMVLFVLLMSLSGWILMFKQTSKSIKICCYALILVLLASLIQLYPWRGRVSLFIIPVFLISFVYPLEIIKNKYAKACYFILLLITFSSYNYGYILDMCNKNMYSKSDGKGITRILKEKYEKTDTVIYNIASERDYKYYSEMEKFTPEQYVILNLPEYDKGLFFQILNYLPKGKNYIFYYSYDWVKKPTLPFLKEWISDKNIVWEYIEGNSYIVKIKL